MKGKMKMSPTSWRQLFTLYVCFIQISKSLLVSAGNSLLNDMFEVMQASWVIAVEYVFKKFS